MKFIKANKHNHVTTTYYLLLKWYERLNWTLEIMSDCEESDDDEHKSPKETINSVMNRSAQNPMRNSLGSD